MSGCDLRTLWCKARGQGEICDFQSLVTQVLGMRETLQESRTMCWDCNQSAWVLAFLLGVWVPLDRVARGNGQPVGKTAAFYDEWAVGSRALV